MGTRLMAAGVAEALAATAGATAPGPTEERKLGEEVDSTRAEIRRALWAGGDAASSVMRVSAYRRRLVFLLCRSLMPVGVSNSRIVDPAGDARRKLDSARLLIRPPARGLHG